jgi:SAM-dependent methyltransferase
MGADYARGREGSAPLGFRYRVRAGFAAAAFRGLAGTPGRVRVLDLGAADGRTLLHLRALLGGAGDFHGVELSAELLAAAPPLPPDTVLVPGDVTRLPSSLQPESYDLCTALAVLEHLADPAACVREAFRMLRPGGVFVATCPSPFWDRVAGTLRMVTDEFHEQAMTRRRMLAVTREAGFADVAFRRFMWAPAGLLPYLGVPLSPRLALRLDSALARVRLLAPGFVNQAIAARRPSLSPAAGEGAGYSAVRRSRITRAGEPAATAKGGTSWVTTAWAPTTASWPTLTPSSTTAPAPSQAPRPMSTPLDGRPWRITGTSVRSNSWPPPTT